MPRDSQGNYALVPGTLVSSGDTILVSQHNPAMVDIAAALSKSLDRDGTGGMRATLNMNGFPIANVLPGVNPNDVATVWPDWRWRCPGWYGRGLRGRNGPRWLVGMRRAVAQPRRLSRTVHSDRHRIRFSR